MNKEECSVEDLIAEFNAAKNERNEAAEKYKQLLQKVYQLDTILVMCFTLLQTWTTNYCADSVEWCPVEHYLNYFICGTYQLQEESSNSTPGVKKSQSRLGQLHLFSVSESFELKQQCTVNCSSGILDCKWYPRRIAGKIIFITANADGKIALWSLEDDDGNSMINHLTELEVNAEHLLLSVDWKVNKNNSDICVSDSAGYIYVIHLNENLTFHKLHTFKVHDNEAWIATFGFNDADNIYSGADDNLLKITDVRSGKRVSELHEHIGGVTSIRFCHTKGHIFASGSYDETIKIWDTRNTSKSLSNLNIGGGIWKIKWDPNDGKHILIAGMYSGCFWLNYDLNTDNVGLECSLNEHSSISYGADISHLKTSDIKKKLGFLVFRKDLKRFYRITATCSFYDKKLCVCLI